MLAAEGCGSVQTHPAILSLQDWPRKVLMGKVDATSNFFFAFFLCIVSGWVFTWGLGISFLTKFSWD